MTPPVDPPTVAVIAAADFPFATVAAAMRSSGRPATGGFARYRDLDAVLAEIDAGRWRYDVAVVGQSRPGQFDRRTVDAVLGRSPLTAWVVRLGPWCVSERRRDPGLWPGGVTVTDEEFAERLTALIGARRDGPMRPPLTARREDVERSRR